MKIVFEEHDLIEIIQDHIKANNILGLEDTDTEVELEVDGTTVSACVTFEAPENDSEDTSSDAVSKPKKRRKRRTKAEIEADKTAEETPTDAAKTPPTEPEIPNSDDESVKEEVVTTQESAPVVDKTPSTTPPWIATEKETPRATNSLFA